MTSSAFLLSEIMQIKINKDGHRHFSFWVPNSLFVNRLTALSISRKSGNMPYGQVWRFMRAFKSFRRKNGKWKLMEVTTPKGEEIEIMI